MELADCSQVERWEQPKQTERTHLASKSMLWIEHQDQRSRLAWIDHTVLYTPNFACACFDYYYLTVLVRP